MAAAAMAAKGATRDGPSEASAEEIDIELVQPLEVQAQITQESVRKPLTNPEDDHGRSYTSSDGSDTTCGDDGIHHPKSLRRRQITYLGQRRMRRSSARKERTFGKIAPQSSFHRNRRATTRDETCIGKFTCSKTLSFLARKVNKLTSQQDTIALLASNLAQISSECKIMKAKNDRLLAENNRLSAELDVLMKELDSKKQGLPVKQESRSKGALVRSSHGTDEGLEYVRAEGQGNMTIQDAIQTLEEHPSNASNQIYLVAGPINCDPNFEIDNMLERYQCTGVCSNSPRRSSTCCQTQADQSDVVLRDVEHRQLQENLQGKRVWTNGPSDHQDNITPDEGTSHWCIGDNGMAKGDAVLRCWVIERNKKTLLKELHPFELVPSLDCLTKKEHRNVIQEEKRHGEPRAVLRLLDLIVSKEEFLPQLLEALREAEQPDIAELLDKDFKNLQCTIQESIACQEPREKDEISKEGSPKSPQQPIININIISGSNVQIGDHNQQHHHHQQPSKLPQQDKDETEYIVEDAPRDEELSPDSDETTPKVVPEPPTEGTTEPKRRVHRAETSTVTDDLVEETGISPASSQSEDLDEHETERRKLYQGDDGSSTSTTETTPVKKLYTWEQSDDITTDGATAEESVVAVAAQSSASDRETSMVIHEMLTMDDLKKVELRDYQKELVQLPKEGHNCIIFAPPKSGKTVIAAEVCRDHLASSVPKIVRDRKKPLKDAVKPNIELGKRKVLYMVPHRPLLYQVYKRLNETLPLWKIGKKSGSSNLSTPLEELLKVYDVLVITPQILQNALDRGSVDISEITLLIFDECHHAKDDHPYNMVMHSYMKKKLHTENPALPQILGLTATPGAGGNNTELSVQEHILNLCSNLDITRPDCFVKVQTPEHVRQIQQHSSCPVKECVEACGRPKNPFSEEINKMMATIERNIGLVSDNQQRGCQEYLSFITLKLQGGYGDPRIRKSCECLLHYNRGLELAHAAQMKDGLQFIADQHRDIERRLTAGKLDETEEMLLGLYRSNCDALKDIVRKEAQYPNPFLQILRAVILEEHGKEAIPNGTTKFRGIVFVKMKIIAQALKQWVLEDQDLKTFLKPEVFLGKGSREESSTSGLSDLEQKEIMSKFAQGECNILFSTSVGEEGIDIPDCNISVRFNHVRDEVSMTQAGGRARAQQSKSVVIADKTALAKEEINIHRETLAQIAIENLCNIKHEEFSKKVNLYQETNLITRQNKEREQSERSVSCVRFYCKGECEKLAFTMADIRRYNGTHYINPDPAFKDRYTTKAIRGKALVKHGVSDHMYCKDCGQKWGGIVDDYPMIGVRCFMVEIDGLKKSVKQWKQIPGKVKNLAFETV